MKRSINVIDLENRIQNNLNPSIKCKKETNEPKEEIKSTDRLIPKKQHPSYDDENDWKKNESFNEDSWDEAEDEEIDDEFGTEYEEEEDDEEDTVENKPSLLHKFLNDKLHLGQREKIDDDIFKIKYNSDTLKNALATLKKMDKVSKSIGECNVPQETLDFIRKYPDFIPSCITDNIKEDNLYLRDDNKDIKDTRKFCADRIHENERKKEEKKNNGYAFADLKPLEKKVPYLKKYGSEDKSPLSSYENVNHPQHYNNYSKEVIDMMVDIFGRKNTALFCEMNAFKYRMRMGTKPNNDINQDLEKEQWYLNKAKELRD